MATLQGRFHYPYIPDEEIELEKGQIIVQGKFYTATRNKYCVQNALGVTLTRSLAALPIMTHYYLLLKTKAYKLYSSTLYLPYQKKMSIDSCVWSYRL